MFNPSSIPVVDLFAGPGGLGEGFSSAVSDPFHIVASAEMDASAHATLRLRAFYRLLRRNEPRLLENYYAYCKGEAPLPYDSSSQAYWNDACNEVLERPTELGTAVGNARLDDAMRKHGIGANSFWVLIGGPPCQAYSLVGRARNQGKKDYVPEEDQRHFLYKEYLRIIQRYRPAVFVMENVKGILSSSVGNQQIFHTILKDLANPDGCENGLPSNIGYRIHSISCSTFFDRTMDPEAVDARDFIVRAEEYGIPQARHRVILVGVREDLSIFPKPLKKALGYATVKDAIGNLPKLRSKLSKDDSLEAWQEQVRYNFQHLINESQKVIGFEALSNKLAACLEKIPKRISCGGMRVPKPLQEKLRPSTELSSWYNGIGALDVWLNHEARGHITEDLRRYAYASSFASVHGRSPKGHKEFALPGLRPNHENWESGKFSDRFRVQIADSPATTITSHISKDGHYFIHFDPKQCRSLTVREAARLQTFPDDYYFDGNRTQQYHQVGNAVPPLLAKKIADQVFSAIVQSNLQAAA